MRKIILSILLGLFLCLLPGCSIQPLQVVLVKGKSLEGRAGIRLIDPNNGPYSIKVTRDDNGSRHYKFRIDADIKQENRWRIKYHWLYYPLTHIAVVEGQVGSGRKYPVMLDSGGALPVILVHDIHVLENKLAIYPFQTNKGHRGSWGLCHLPKLHIGEMTLVNWPCMYREKHAELQVFGLPIAHDEMIIVGLPVLRRFKYIVFDNTRKEVEFSAKEVFEPDKPELWGQYPFSIEVDSDNNAFLFVKIPIAGEEMELQLDTGSGGGLLIREELWDKIGEKIHSPKLKDGTSFSFCGRLSCKKGAIKKIQVGHRIVKNAIIEVFPSDCPLFGKRDQELLGMQCFRDTVMVLDFERNLMWVKNNATD